jgi:hypothetical protein
MEEALPEGQQLLLIRTVAFKEWKAKVQLAAGI